MLTLRGNGNAATERQRGRGSRKQLRKRKRIRINVMLKTRRKSTDYSLHTCSGIQNRNVGLHSKTIKSSVNVIMVCVTLARTAAYYQPLLTLALRLQSTIILRSYETLGNIRRGRSRAGGGRPRSRGRTSNGRKSEAGGFCNARKARSAGPFRCGYVDRGQKEADGKAPSAERTFLARVYTKGDACRADQNADANLEKSSGNLFRCREIDPPA